MARFAFETKALKRFGDLYSEKARDAAKDIAPTPFSMDYEYVEKELFEKLERLNLEVYSKHDTIKKSFSMVTNLFATLLPTWNWQGALIAGYIIKHLDYNSNVIRITEEDFIGYSGYSAKSFYEGLNTVIRAETPYVTTGDSLKLLARTTRKSIYVVNHNIIFKGSLEFFVETYKEKFPNPCELDSRGKVVIRY